MCKEIVAIEDPKQYKEKRLNHNPFVELVDGTDFFVRMQYPKLHMKHAEEKCYVREEVYRRLLIAKEELPKGMNLCVWDAWRPFKLQEELYSKYYEEMFEKFHLASVSEEEQERVMAQYISKPIYDKIMAPVHTTGGAVDVTLVGEDGTPMDMGTVFDEFTEVSHTAYFEGTSNEVVKANRRLLYHVMSVAGFTNLPSEWWHYDYGNRFWAYYNQKKIVYEGIFQKEELYF